MAWLSVLVSFLQRTYHFLVVENWPITLTTLVGLVGVYLLLPRARGYPPLWGALASAAAVLLAARLLVRAESVHPETILFYAFSGIAIVSGGLLVTQPNPVRAALSFALVVLSSCGLFLLQAAPFLMAATVIVYAGAIVVTFLFVIMLAQQAGLSDADQRSREPLLACVAGFVLLGTLLYLLQSSYSASNLDDLLRQTRQVQEELERLKREIQERSGDVDRVPREQVDECLGTLDLDELLAHMRSAVTRASIAPDGSRSLDELTPMMEAQSVIRNPEIDLAELGKRLREVERTGAEARNRLATLQGDHPAQLSTFSAYPGSPSLAEPLRDAEGRPLMPAQNVAALGRTLYTDYLLAVELGGTLLLVAAIGAIAITGRRPEGLK